MKLSNRDDFIKKSVLIYEEIYDYSNVIYVNSRTKVCIDCSEHGVFFKTPNNHLNGQGCPKCGIGNRTPTTEEFISRSKAVHGEKYNYDKSKFLRGNPPIKIGCSTHGYFLQDAYTHMSGGGCVKCLHDSLRLGIDKFILSAQKIHGMLYNYSNIQCYINSHTKVPLSCNKHGIFWQTPNSHLSGIGCPICNMSKGEIKIHNWLVDNSVSFVRQYFIRKYKFDFFLPDHKLLIEYDGEQHFSAVPAFHKNLASFKKQQERDKFKNKIASSSGLELLRIPYWKQKFINHVLFLKLNTEYQ